MCGINLIIERRQGKGKDAITKMTRQTAYRGPDHQQILSLALGDYDLHLGFNRLSLINLSIEAHQPFFSACGHYVLMFNGEIYNYLTLKKILLQKGIIFKTQSDTEVLLQWLMVFGTEGLAQVNGMFALVWVDLQNQSVWLIRDAAGMKPLFCAQQGESFIASSVIEGMMASGYVSKKLNKRAIDHYLQYRYAQAPNTFFEDIRELLPREVIRWRPNMPLSSYFFNKAENALASQDVEILLSNAVVSHLQADVSGGIFLSGGADSTLLLALANREGINIPSFCIYTGYEDEVRFARMAANQYGSDLHEVEFGQSALAAWPDFVSQIDQPIADTAAWLTYVLSSEANKQVKFVLSGAGADELFAGYHRHQAFNWYLHNPTMVNWAIRLRTILLSAVKLAGNEKKRLISRFLVALDKNPQQTFLNFTRLQINPSELSSNTEVFDNWLSWALQYDQEHYLVGDVLAVSDRMSMKHGLEMRMPYLDQNVIQWARTTNPQTLLEHSRKSPIHRLLNKLGGKAFTERNKYGFGLPMAQWIREGTLNEMVAILDNHNAKVYQFVDYSRTQGLLQAHRLGKEDFSADIYAIMLLAHWLERNA